LVISLADELNSNDDGEWRKNLQSSLNSHDTKLLAAFAPSSQQDMQVKSVTNQI
jgi:hypothetical protein